MQELNLPVADLNMVQKNGKTMVFDVVRKKYFVLQPEEWVRQHIIHYLNSQLGYPFSLLAVEKGLTYNGKNWRADIVAFNNSGKPQLIIECKAPEVPINQQTFMQAARYNLVYKVPFLIVSNGLTHYCSRVDLEKGTFEFLNEFPSYQSICNID
tara:strand:- start:6 stop:467 length:462 start_codon:yes stop_codon:yes gene_type:complete